MYQVVFIPVRSGMLTKERLWQTGLVVHIIDVKLFLPQFACVLGKPLI